MKTSKIAINVLKNTIHIIAIISIFIIMLQIRKNQGYTELAMVEANQEEQVAEITESSEDEQRTQNQVTSRSSIARRASENLEQKEIVKEEPIEEQVEEIIIEEQYAKIEDITISREMDLTVTTNLSKEDFKRVISNLKYDTSKFFYNNSDYIYDVCNEYQINEIFFCGLISAESGWDIAYNHRRTFNYISLMSQNGLIQFGSVEDGLASAARTLHNNYLTEGGRFYNGKTLYGVKTRFCPASSMWVELVYGRMKQIMNCI